MRLAIPFLPFEMILRRRPVAPVRWSIRGAMIGIAVSALLIGLGLHLARLNDRAIELRVLAERYSRLAAEDWWLAGRSVASADQAERTARGPDGSPDPRSSAERLGTAARLREASVGLYRRAEYHHRLSRKYRAAQEHPVLPVWPDEAEP